MNKPIELTVSQPTTLRFILPTILVVAVTGLMVGAATALDLLVPLAILALAITVAIAMLSSLSFAVVIAVFSMPFEGFVIFDSLGTLSRLLIIGMAGSFIFHVLRGRVPLRLGASSVAGICWVLWLLASLIWSPGKNVGGVLTVVQLVVMALTIAACIAARPRLLKLVLWSYTIGALVTAALGILNFLSALDSTGAGRTSAISEQSVAHFGAYLVPALIFLLVYSLNSSRHWLRRLSAVLLSLPIALAILMSGTRSAWMAVLVAILVIIVPKLNLRMAGGLLATIALVVGLVLTIPGLGELVVQRSTIAISTGGAGRLDIWGTGLGLVSKSPVLGLGYGEFPTHFTPQAIEDTPFNVNRYSLILGRAPHSIYVQNLIELGLVGIVLFLVWMFPLAIRLSGNGAYIIAVRATFLAFLVQGAYLDILNRKYFWLFVGLAEACRWWQNRRSNPRLPRQSNPGVSHARKTPELSMASRTLKLAANPSAYEVGTGPVKP